jgi:hypothetical protein
MKNFFLLGLILVISLSLLESRKRKKKQKEKKDNDPKSKRPEKIKPEQWCDVCQAIIIEAGKFLMGKKKESDVIDYMEDICNQEKYYTYHHTPPEMKEGCEHFISAFDEEVAQVLINRPDDTTPIHKLCYEMTQACTGVDPSKVKSMPDEIMVDNEPIKITPQIQEANEVKEDI